MKKWTGERLEPFIYNRIAIEHLHRYAITSAYIKDKVVLDIASGEGYGTSLMGKHASFAYGVDIDKESIALAKLKYKEENIQFLEGSTSNIPLANNSVDVVVSFETIEHHDEHEKMMSEIKRVLRPEGILIISTPDKFYYSEVRDIVNEFHVKELYKNEFTSLISNDFSNFQLLSQTYSNGNSIIQDDTNVENSNYFYGNYSTINKKVINPMFLIIIASDQIIEKYNISFFDGGDFIKRGWLDEVKASNTYKVGHAFLLPFKFLKRILK